MLFAQVDPTAVYDDCWFDACVLNDADAGNAVLCAALKSYVEQCAQNNVTIERWRTATLCRKSTPASGAGDSHAVLEVSIKIV